MLLSSVCCVDCKRSTCEQAERRSGGDATRGYLERTHLLPLLPQQLLQLAHALTLLLELGAEARLGAIGHRGGLAHARGCVGLPKQATSCLCFRLARAVLCAQRRSAGR